MKKRLFIVSAFFFAAGASAQVSTGISKEEFASVLADSKIQLNWNAVESLKSKTEIKAADESAVYGQYLNALRESELNDNAETAAVIRREIEAVEQHLNLLKK